MHIQIQGLAKPLLGCRPDRRRGPGQVRGLGQVIGGGGGHRGPAKLARVSRTSAARPLANPITRDQLTGRWRATFVARPRFRAAFHRRPSPLESSPVPWSRPQSWRYFGDGLVEPKPKIEGKCPDGRLVLRSETMAGESPGVEVSAPVLNRIQQEPRGAPPPGPPPADIGGRSRPLRGAKGGVDRKNKLDFRKGPIGGIRLSWLE